MRFLRNGRHLTYSRLTRTREHRARLAVDYWTTFQFGKVRRLPHRSATSAIMSSAFNRLLLAVAMLHNTHAFSIRAVNKLPPRPAIMNQARLRGGLGPEARVVDMHVAAAAMFGNIRTPAALVAGACLLSAMHSPFRERTTRRCCAR